MQCHNEMCFWLFGHVVALFLDRYWETKKSLPNLGLHHKVDFKGEFLESPPHHLFILNYLYILVKFCSLKKEFIPDQWNIKFKPKRNVKRGNPKTLSKHCSGLYYMDFTLLDHQ